MLNTFFIIFGGSWSKFKRALLGWLWFLRDFSKIRKQNRNSMNKWKFSFFPILYDKFDDSGVARGQYFYQDVYVARKIYDKNPLNHLDIASRIDGFVAHVSIFRVIDVMDIRPLSTKIKNINFIQLDLMKSIPNNYIQKYHSLSCLHAIEHFGLGRYGDEIEIDGHIRALENIKNFLIKDGIFYFSTQIGQQRIEFNAGRVFSIKYLLDILLKDFTLLDFSYIDDEGELWESIELDENNISSNCKCNLGCGIFTLKKK